MGKGSDPPAPPDYAAAATAQGAANLNSALATNYINQVNQVTPQGSQTYNSDYSTGHYLPDGTFIPQTTATTTLSPEQQKLYDQNTAISTSLNDLAKQGIGYVGNAVSSPTLANQFPALDRATSPDQFLKQRDDATNALMARLQPMQDRDRALLENKMANQGLSPGSEAAQWETTQLGQQQNDARNQALLAGNDVQNQLFNEGLASNQFNNQAQQQAIQEADYFKNQPLNMLNALRTGNQVTMPTFGNVATGASPAPAPIYQSTVDGYNAQMANYQAQQAQSNSLLGGLGSLGAAAITKFSDRRLKRNVQQIGRAANGLMLYAFDYIWNEPSIGHMAEEVELVYPDAVGWLGGYQTVDYGRLV